MKTAVASLVVVLCLVLPGAAMAGTASLEVGVAELGPTRVENLNYRAAAGERNRLRVSFDGAHTYSLTDTAGITPGRRCSRPDPADTTRVICVQSPGGTEIGGVTLRLGDRNDRATVSGRGAVVLGGPGSDVMTGSRERDTLSAGGSTAKPSKSRTRDRLRGQGGGDTLLGSAGDNRISGGQGLDVISAGRGDDRINARDRRVDQVRCGGGFDVARLDSADFLADRCRAVSRPGLPAATPIDLFTTPTDAFVVVGCPRDALVQRCRGSAEIRRGGRSFGRKRFNLRRGRRKARRFSLPSDIQREIGPTGGPRVRVLVRSISGENRRTTFFVSRRLPPPGD